MPQYIAFLRGINVGGHRVRMDRLREIFEELGLTDVSTFIASGNVIFSSESEDLEHLSLEIEQHLAERLGYEVATFLRSPAQLEAIGTRHEPPTDDARAPASGVYVIFLKEPASEELRATVLGLVTATDEFEFSDSEIYWLLGVKLTDSPIATEVGRALKGIPTTMRNMNTVRRLVAKTGS